METIDQNGQSTDVRETAFNSYAGSPTATIFTEERKWITKVLRWKEQYPNEVTIQSHDKEFGSMVALVPQSWMKMSPKRKISEEQKRAASERFKEMHRKRNVD